jgi:hypothetical protein
MNGGAPGTSLGSSGFARLITPADNMHGRWVSNLVNLEVFDTSNWLILPQQSIDLGGVNFQTLGFQLQGGTLTSSGGSATLTAPTYTLGGGLIDTGVVLGPSGVVTQSSGLTVLKGTISAPSVAIAGGTLEVDGLISGASTVTVSSGARLSGTGIVDPLTTTITSGGTLAPGNPANPTGMLAIAGNLAFQSGALYLIQATPSAASSTLMNGSASLNGTVQASFASGSYVTKQYTVLATTGGLGGSRFSSLANTNLPAGFNDNLTYDSNKVYLNLAAVLGGTGSGLNGNQQNVATGLNNYFNNGGALPPGFFWVFGLTGAPLATALSRLDGENAADAQKGASQLMSNFLNLMLDPYSGGGRVNIGGDAAGFAPEQDATLPPDIALAYGAMLTKAPPKPVAPDQRWTAWGGAFGGTGNFNGDPVVGSNNVTASDFGFAAGMDYHLSRDSLIGFALAGGGPIGTSHRASATAGAMRSRLVSMTKRTAGRGTHRRHLPLPTNGSRPIASRPSAISSRPNSRARASPAGSKPATATDCRLRSTLPGSLHMPRCRCKTSTLRAMPRRISRAAVLASPTAR